MHSSNPLRPACLLIFLLLLCVGLGSANSLRPLIIIDPGHGGKDPGADYGIYEKTVNLQLAFALEQRLHDLDIDTAITRDRDVYLSLGERARYPAKFSGPKLFVSLHYNAHERKGAKGIETFYHSMASRSLATRIQSALIRSTRATDRGIKQRRDLGVLRSNKADVAVLVEGGFLSNHSERQCIAHPGYRDLQARAIAEAIAGYVGKPPRPTPSYQSGYPVAQKAGVLRPDLQITAMRSRATRPPLFPLQRRTHYRQR